MDRPLLYQAAKAGIFGQHFVFEDSTITDALFVYLDGTPDPDSISALEHYRSRPLVCLTAMWEDYIRVNFPDAKVYRRFAMKPTCRFRLENTPRLPDGFECTPFDENAFDLHPFSHGENYPSFADFRQKGAGAVVWHDGEIIASAASFLSLNNEVELDVSTEEAYRGKGLATACISAMLQACMQRGITVHWDAQNDTSRHLAEKFGFEEDYTYSVYWLPEKSPKEDPMLTFKTLEGVPSDVLYKTFDEAFSDYPVNLGFDEAKLQLCLDRRRCENIHSYGAFGGDQLIGFVSNAVRVLDGELTAYDALTGVSVHHRRSGAGKGMMEASAEHFRSMGIKRYLLEVIDTNEKAYNLYKSVGFTFSRKLDCYALSEKQDLEICHDIHLVKPDDALWTKLTTFWDHAPSWQNNVDSVRGVLDTMHVAVAFEGDEPVGYVVCEKESCAIAQIAVAQDKRRQGIGTSLLAFIGKNTPSKGISISNVDDRSGTLAAFFIHHGFHISIILHELERKL